MSFSCWEHQKYTGHSWRDLTRAQWRGKITSFKLLTHLFQCSPLNGFLGCKHTLQAHDEFFINIVFLTMKKPIVCYTQFLSIYIFKIIWNLSHSLLADTAAKNIHCVNMQCKFVKIYQHKYPNLGF